MAKLIKCKDCGWEVSKNADTCPQYHSPVKRKSVGCISGIFIVILVVFAGTMVMDSLDNDSPNITQTPKVAPKVDCSNNSERDDFIQRMIKQRHWEKVESGAGMIRLYVMPVFMNSATFGEKQQFVSVASAWSICNGNDGMVRLINAMNNDNLGYYSTDLGLQLD